MGIHRAHRLALAGVLALVAACGGGGDERSGSRTYSYGTGDDATTTTTAAEGAPETTAAAQAGRVDAASTTTALAGATTSTTARAGDVIPVGALRVGQLAPALLRPGRGDRIVLEVRAQAGMAPAAGTLDHLVSVLRSVSGKAVVVDGVYALDGSARSWTPSLIIDAARSAAQIESGRDQVVLRLLFVRGSFEGDSGVLGVAVAGDVAAIFGEQIDAAAGLLVSPSVVEDAVAMHETGHLLGLVDLVLGTGRGDPDHPGHSRNRRSVMYWQVESDLITQLLDGGIPRDFDADDRTELAAIRRG